MMEHDRQGNLQRTRRHVSTRLQAEILTGNDWREVAYLELLRISLEVKVYHEQLRGRLGYEETGKAYDALQAAVDAFVDDASDEQDTNGQGARLI